MEVMVDGSKAEVELGEPGTVGDLFAGIDQLLADSGRVRLETVVDGETVTADSAPSLESRSVEEIGEVRITSRDAGELARETLSEARSILPELRGSFERVSYLMQGGKKEEAFDLLQKSFVEWRDIIQLFSLVEGFLQIDYKVTFIGEKTIDEINQELLGLLGNTKDAMVDSDLVTLSDLLEYEIAPRIEEQIQIIDELMK